MRESAKDELRQGVERTTFSHTRGINYFYRHQESAHRGNCFMYKCLIEVYVKWHIILKHSRFRIRNRNVCHNLLSSLAIDI